VRRNLFRMLPHTETPGGRVLALGSALLSQLVPKARELAILRLGHESGSDYAWTQHIPLALSAGVTQAQIEAVEQGVDKGSFHRSGRSRRCCLRMRVREQDRFGCRLCGDDARIHVT
jgi:hypothetical protein